MAADAALDTVWIKEAVFHCQLDLLPFHLGSHRSAHAIATRIRRVFQFIEATSRRAALFQSNKYVFPEVYVARTLVHQPDYSLWRCKSAEQQMVLNYALDCYASLNEHNRAQRVIRQQAPFDTVD